MESSGLWACIHILALLKSQQILLSCKHVDTLVAESAKQLSTLEHWLNGLVMFSKVDDLGNVPLEDSWSAGPHLIPII